MAERSKELILVGYYLSRFGISSPPERFDNVKWNEVYRMFYESLSKGREVLEFEHSIKNTRDSYDSYFPENDRSGWWKTKYSLPPKLPKLALAAARILYCGLLPYYLIGIRCGENIFFQMKQSLY
jgi:hypothetical protein